MHVDGFNFAIGCVLAQPSEHNMDFPMSYDGPEDTTKMDLAEPGKDPKIMYIATDLDLDEEWKLIELLQEYRNVFGWSLKDIKGWINIPFPYERMLNRANNVRTPIMTILQQKLRQR